MVVFVCLIRDLTQHRAEGVCQEQSEIAIVIETQSHGRVADSHGVGVSCFSFLFRNGRYLFCCRVLIIQIGNRFSPQFDLFVFIVGVFLLLYSFLCNY